MIPDHPHQGYNFGEGGSGSGSTSASGVGGRYNDVTGKAKMADEQDAVDDELLSVLGYNVQSSDMANIDHYNHPSDHDLSTWLDTMTVELSPTTGEPLLIVDSDNSNTVTVTSNNSSNVRATAPATVDPNLGLKENFASVVDDVIQPPGKRLIPPSLSSALPSTSTSNNANVILKGSEDNGVRLIQTLMACAGSVQQGNFQLAENLVKEAGILAVSQVSPMKKIAAYFSEGLARRIYGFHRHTPEHSPAFNDLLLMHFYEACPYLKFAQFTANQAILEAFSGKKRVHVIDFSMKQGIQWPALMQALAVRTGGPPSFRLTAIGMSTVDQLDQLQESGRKLSRLASTINMNFEYRPLIVDCLADIEPAVLNLRDGEVLAVNSVFELHQLLAIPGAVERLLWAVRAMKPEIVTVVEQEANHNGDDFMERFKESLGYYCSIFDSLESINGDGCSSEMINKYKIMSEVYLGKQICNVVACEGQDRVERHETLTQWRNRLGSAGFQAAHLGWNAFSQASTLLEIFASGNGYTVEETDGCLMLGWHSRSLITTSAWNLG